MAKVECPHGDDVHKEMCDLAKSAIPRWVLVFLIAALCGLLTFRLVDTKAIAELDKAGAVRANQINTIQSDVEAIKTTTNAIWRHLSQTKGGTD